MCEDYYNINGVRVRERRCKTYKHGAERSKRFYDSSAQQSLFPNDNNTAKRNKYESSIHSGLVIYKRRWGRLILSEEWWRYLEQERPRRESNVFTKLSASPLPLFMKVEQPFHVYQAGMEIRFSRQPRSWYKVDSQEAGNVIVTWKLSSPVRSREDKSSSEVISHRSFLCTNFHLSFISRYESDTYNAGQSVDFWVQGAKP